MSMMLKEFLNQKITILQNLIVPQHMNKIVKHLISIMLFTISSCNSLYSYKDFEKLENEIKSISKVVDKFTYHNDSMQIVNSIRWGFDNDSYFFNTYVRLGPQKSSEVNIYVDRIFYSLDSSQLFAFIVLEEPTKFAENPYALTKPNNRYSYDGALVLSNKKENNKWILYASDIFRPSGYTYYEEIQFKFYTFFLNDMIKRKGNDYGCTINENCFWSESNGFWRYGEIIPGYYNFQINANKNYFKATGKNVDSLNVEEYLYKPLQE